MITSLFYDNIGRISAAQQFKHWLRLMEDSFLVSPAGNRHPRTPENEAAVHTMHQFKNMMSNKKLSPSKSKSLFQESIVPKVHVQVPNVQVQVPKVPLSRDRDEENQMLYQAKMRETEQQLRDLERQIEVNEVHHREELIRVQSAREVEGTSQQRYRSREIEAKERELSLRERELDLKQSERSALAERTKSKNEVTQHCCLSISDPAGDVVCDLAVCMTLEAGLCNERLSVSTVHSLFDTAVTRHETLRKILALVSEGQSCRFVIQKFKNVFGSLFKVSRSTMSLVSILAKARISNSALSKVKSAIKFTASRTLDVLMDAVPLAEKSGIVPAVDSSFKLMKLTELPGIVQLLARSDPAGIEEHWSAIDSFVDAVIFFVSDKKLKLQEAERNLSVFDGTHYVDCSEMLADYNSLSDICMSWFGSEMKTDYDKIQSFLHRCPVIVQTQYARHVSTPINGVNVDEFRMEWAEFENTLHSVWFSAFTELQVQMQFGLNIQEQSQVQIRPSNSSQQVLQMQQVNRQPTQQSITGDIGIICVDCNSNFIWAVSQQEKHKKQGYENTPKRCAKCKGLICDSFKNTGECSYGDNCKYLHSKGPESPQDSQQAPQIGPAAPVSPVKKHPYHCRFERVGTCLNGENCNFQHESDKAGTVHMMAQDMSQWSNRFRMPDKPDKVAEIDFNSLD